MALMQANSDPEGGAGVLLSEISLSEHGGTGSVASKELPQVVGVGTGGGEDATNGT